MHKSIRSSTKSRTKYKNRTNIISYTLTTHFSAFFFVMFPNMNDFPTFEKSNSSTYDTFSNHTNMEFSFLQMETCNRKSILHLEQYDEVQI